MKTLREYIAEARKNNIAIGHFNICTLDGVWAVVDAAKGLNVPVIIGVSEGERDYVGVKAIAAVVKSIRESTGQPVFLNADHTYSFEGVKACVDAGFDSVIFDGTGLSHEENVRITRACVEYAKSKNPEIIVEAELGFIGTSSKVWNELPDGVKTGEEFLTKPEEAKKFIEETGIDMLAPAIGNFHGMLKVGHKPPLNIKRIVEIKEAVKIPMVLHGASGESTSDIQNAIKAGMNIVHVNTEIRVAFRKALEAELIAKPDDVAPYKYMESTIPAVEKVIEEKLKIFNFL